MTKTKDIWAKFTSPSVGGTVETQKSGLDLAPAPVYNVPTVEEVANAVGETYTADQMEVAKILRAAKLQYSQFAAELSKTVYLSQDSLELTSADLDKIMSAIISMKDSISTSADTVLATVL